MRQRKRERDREKETDREREREKERERETEKERERQRERDRHRQRERERRERRERERERERDCLICEFLFSVSRVFMIHLQSPIFNVIKDEKDTGINMFAPTGGFFWDVEIYTFFFFKQEEEWGCNERMKIYIFGVGVKDERSLK